MANTFEVSVKPLAPWLWAGYFVFFATYLFCGFGIMGRRRTFCRISGVVAWGCYSIAFWIKRRYTFETLRGQGAKGYLPRSGAEFSIPVITRIWVQDVNSVLPWYIEKFGLRKLAENAGGEVGVATLRFKEDGSSIILTKRGDFRTGKTPIFFTKKIGKMRDVMAARGVNVGMVEYDRQGTRYFQIRDPEGNEIEVVEEP
jgi:predicted enzyme related to lactoylglutathione lyase